MAEMRVELDRALRRLAQLLEASASAALGAVPCSGDHGAALPCPQCGAAL